MIVVRDLVKDYGDRRAIHSLNFSVEKGEIVGFLGPNGAGKSTTMKIITGFMAPTSGEVASSGGAVLKNRSPGPSAATRSESDGDAPLISGVMLGA